RSDKQASADKIPSRMNEYPREMRLFAWLWVVSALFVVYGTTIPFHFTSSRGHARAKLSRVRLNPLVSPETGRRVSISDFVQNVLLFLPFGAFGVGTLRARQANVMPVLIAGVSAACLSTAVEGL